jgi:(E)-4-hydroxy-3-methylbut-2-enyl-diphosphate synthase
MVESALEFLRICEDLNFYNIVLSMKSSNPQVMVQAYRLLVQKLDEERFQAYPLHLGVTEAGDGEDGRIKSSVGIGTLLEDGLGDTVRVSLTEEPEAEVPVAQDLARRYDNRKASIVIPEITHYPIDPFSYTRRHTHEVMNIGGHNVPRVMADFSMKKKITQASLFALGYHYSVPLDKWNIADMACDYIFLGDNTIDFEIPGTLAVVQNQKTWLTQKNKPNTYPFIPATDYKKGAEKSDELNFVYACLPDVDSELILKLNSDKTAVLVIDTYTDMGGLLIDGLGDGVFIAAENCGSDKMVNETAFNILQATRTRISKTEYISCPSCGRTLFDLQETTAKIRLRTSHLKGVKIGIMGCIVNGPGEMADADYGYVGSGPGRITLYKGKEVVKRNVPTPQAVDELINLIKDGGDWIEVGDNREM